jgi:hypothetical protein
LAAAGVAVASYTIASAVRADTPPVLSGTYHMVPLSAAGALTERINLIVRLRNFSGANIASGVLELDSYGPAPPAQSFPSAISLPDRGTILINGVFTVPSSDARRWQSPDGPPPLIVLVAKNASGATVRWSVQLTWSRTAGE